MTAMCTGSRLLFGAVFPCPNEAHPDYTLCAGCVREHRPARRRT